MTKRVSRGTSRAELTGSGIHDRLSWWIPAFAGMTASGLAVTGRHFREGGNPPIRSVPMKEVRTSTFVNLRQNTPDPDTKAESDSRVPGWLAAAILYTLAYGWPAPAAELPGLELESPPGIMVGLGSHRLHIHCTGEGSPAVIFESGLGGTSLDWSRVQPAVSEFTRACSYDRAGYGWSEPGPSPRHAARLAAELDRLLLSAGVPPPYVLVGHSFGGLAIRILAARREQTVAGLVLVDTVHERQFQHMQAAGVRTPTAPTGRRFVITNPGIVPEGLPESVKPLAQRLAAMPKAVRALYGELEWMRTSAWQVGSIHGAPDAPVIVLSRGPRSGDASLESIRLDGAWLDLQQHLAGSMNNGALRVVDDSGHHIHLDRPEQVVAAIRVLVEAVRVRPNPDPSRTAANRESESVRNPWPVSMRESR